MKYEDWEKRKLQEEDDGTTYTRTGVPYDILDTEVPPNIVAPVSNLSLKIIKKKLKKKKKKIRR